MSKALSQLRVFTERDFKEANRVERIFIWMMEPEKFTLNHYDQTYFDRLKTIFTIMCENLEQKVQMTLIQNIYTELAPYQLYGLMNDAEALFGKVRKVNKDFQRGLQRERLKSYIEWLSPKEIDPKKEPDNSKPFKPVPDDAAKLLLKAEELLMKLDRLDAEENDETFDWDSLKIPKADFTSDPKYLHAEDAVIDDDGE